MQHKSNFKIQEIPAKPGVYVFRNSSGEVIYVGKAKSLRKRMASYFQPSRKQTADVKLRSLINSIVYFEYFSVNNEAEAYLLESRLVKQYTPRYNTELRDDKRFLLICLDPNENFPHLELTRLKKADGRIYFGPFPHARAVRQTMNYLARKYGLRTCTKPNCGPDDRRHCLKKVIHACSQPCIGKIDQESYREKINEVISILRGNSSLIEKELEEKMRNAVTEQKFEEAGKWRDILQNIREVCRTAKTRNFDRARLATQSVDGVKALQEAIGLKHSPERIECFDISNIGGLLAVGSMVVFYKGRAVPKEYRRYRVRCKETADDFAMMAEVVGRRYRRLREEGKQMPDLVIVDGGRGQLNAAVQALEAENIPALPVIGLAKQYEEVYIPGRKTPLRISRHDAGLKLLQAVRDEAHRFALAYHRSLRNRRLSESVLNEIDGVGPKTKQALLKQFGSVKQLRQVEPEDIAARIRGISLEKARRISKHLT